ncbi:hypothetical protein BV22DRAFT_1038486 [Leucogyrophana mollusca]|uniref:Uncharacterized protein n=1 Tax=Leucogyrophana mollusca TaxID=85980 RepID=A0ACB8B8I3_9AGAM|nr:hypothetical protein BV22DRAFT_1038486 [Leucogyrophana mollusca]
MELNQEYYLPLLPNAVGDGEDPESPDSLLYEKLPDKQISSTTSWLTITVSLISIFIAVSLHFSSISMSFEDASHPRFVASLRKVSPYPNVGDDTIDDAMGLKSAPKMWFPWYIVRANAAEPDRKYTTSSSVTLSPSDSMFYRFTMKNPANSTCYVTAAVPNAAKQLAGNKNYVSEGDVSAIEIWNVSYTDLPTELSWNTRPPRQSLLGTVNFAPPPDVYDPDDERDGMELRPPTPLFECGGNSRIAIEVACSDCRLSFEQVFSDPPLAFDVWVLA